MIKAFSKELAPKRWDNLRALISQNGVIRIEENLPSNARVTGNHAAGSGPIGACGGDPRVHGGAVSIESRLKDNVFEDKTALAVREKRRIAEAALTLCWSPATRFISMAAARCWNWRGFCDGPD